MQCDLFRMNFPNGEQLWHEMMNNAQHISKQQFLSQVDPSGMLDNDGSVTIEQELDDFMIDDPSAYFAHSNMGGKEVYFIDTHGFEFIFTK